MHPGHTDTFSMICLLVYMAWPGHPSVLHIHSKHFVRRLRFVVVPILEEQGSAGPLTYRDIDDMTPWRDMTCLHDMNNHQEMSNTARAGPGALYAAEQGMQATTARVKGD
jgi:hypothetical protein